MKSNPIVEQEYLSQSLPGERKIFDPKRAHIIGVLMGEGVGDEVVPAALEVLQVLADRGSRHFDVRIGGAIGKEAFKTSGKWLTGEVIDFCAAVFADGGALFCGPGGGRFVYDLRAHFDLFCKFTPLRPVLALGDTGLLRLERVSGVDIVAVRENTGGLYYGNGGWEEDARTAYHCFSYQAEAVDRILAVGYRLARARRGKLCVTIKSFGVPTISQLWEERVHHLHCQPEVAVRVLEIDNAAYQLVANAHDFDVVVSPNMFGDVLADGGALLLGARGMSYSGNFGPAGRAVYQTGHGSAYDIVGTDSANPIGQIHALAMMLRESFDWPAGASAIHEAVETTLAQGYRTPDIAARGCRLIGTRELARRVCANLAKIVVSQ
ncbi:3-isopropylmalate dehydrogenase [Gammaproteobacteria bacterium]